jgi:hypothetical protein
MKVKHLIILVDEKDYAKYIQKKGDRTWLQVLQDGLKIKRKL